MIPRAAKAKLLHLLQRFPAVALLGPRQAGKTTLPLSLEEQSLNPKLCTLTWSFPPGASDVCTRATAALNQDQEIDAGAPARDCQKALSLRLRSVQSVRGLANAARTKSNRIRVCSSSHSSGMRHINSTFRLLNTTCNPPLPLADCIWEGVR